MRKVFYFIPLLFLFSCAKEKEGAVQFRAQTRGNYTYSNFNVGLAHRQYGDPIKTASSTERFMAYQIIDRLEKQNEVEMLNRLQLAVETKDRQRNKQHEVWEDGILL